MKGATLILRPILKIIISVFIFIPVIALLYSFLATGAIFTPAFLLVAVLLLVAAVSLPIKKLLLTLVSVWVIFGIVASVFAPYFIDFWWFESLGFQNILLTTWWAKIALFAGVFVLSSAFFLVNFLVSAGADSTWQITINRRRGLSPITVSALWVKRFGVIACFLLGILFGLGASTHYLGVLKFLNAVPFGKADPVFKLDISVYVFYLPIFEYLVRVVRNIVTFCTIGCFVVYALRGVKGLGKLPATVRHHLSFLASLFTLTILGGIILNIFGLLSKASGPIYGAAITDVNVRIPLMELTAVMAGLLAVTFLVYGIIGNARLLLVSGLLLLVTVVLQGIVPAYYHSLNVAPNELAMETPLIKNHIAATRDAYGLDGITEGEISGDQTLTAKDIADNSPTLKNVRLWDRAPLLSTFSQLQEIRTYYNFVSIDDDRYTIGGDLRQLLLSSRELDTASLPSPTWTNKHLVFTHGYGLTAGPVNEVSSEGLPVLFLKDLPPVATTSELKITRPEIYFGELTNDYAVVNTGISEFDYPKGDENIFAKYGGQGGVLLNSELKRFIFGLKFDTNLLLSRELTPRSRILYFRQIQQRLSKLVPYLVFDRDPYLVVSQGRLLWLADAYTVTDKYPYSRPLSSYGEWATNYVRNSVKAVVDAYDGGVTFYQADLQDPIIRTYAKIFPGIFKPIAQMPPELLAHIKYPQDLFMTQAGIYATYHMNEPQAFYNKEDQWQLAYIGPSGDSQAEAAQALASPRHLVMRLPGETRDEFVFMIPFTPSGKDNLSAWMVARNDGTNYGKLLTYRFSKQKLIYGPKQITARINQDAGISSQLTLWDQKGSQVNYGPMLIVPIKESLLYIQPLYLKATSGNIPELKRVIVVYNDRVVMDESLDKALAQIFVGNLAPTASQTSAPTGTQVGAGTDSFLQKAQSAYLAAIDAQKAGDWAKYGQEMSRLGEILKQAK
jgi:uncharacterized membrane protein (UPF0182 family)